MCGSYCLTTCIWLIEKQDGFNSVLRSLVKQRRDKESVYFLLLLKKNSLVSNGSNMLRHIHKVTVSHRSVAIVPPTKKTGLEILSRSASVQDLLIFNVLYLP